jgi:hypothetical protein
MADELYALVKERQREEFEACKRAASASEGFDEWLQPNRR